MAPRPIRPVAARRARAVRRGLCRLVTLGRLATGRLATLGPVAVLSGASVIAALGPPVGAAPPRSTMFRLTGSVSGTLHMANRACGGTGGQFVFDGTTLKGSQATTWTVNVNAPSSGGGTWTKLPPRSAGVPDVSVVLEGQTSAKDSFWITGRGRITTATWGGSVDVTLGPDHTLSGAPGHGDIHLSGSWACTAS